MAALVAKRPYLEISPEESKKLAVALQSIAKQYDVKVAPAVMAWLQLAGVSTAIYAPRIAIELSFRKAMAMEARKAATLTNAGTNAAQTMAVAPMQAAPSPNGAMNFGAH